MINNLFEINLIYWYPFFEFCLLIPKIIKAYQISSNFIKRRFRKKTTIIRIIEIEKRGVVLLFFLL